MAKALSFGFAKTGKTSGVLSRKVFPEFSEIRQIRQIPSSERQTMSDPSLAGGGTRHRPWSRIGQNRGAAAT
jgi:hypothetical protein